MATFKRPVILFFIAGAAPSEDEIAAAEAFGLADIKFRNAAAVVLSEKMEPCDGVAGDVPDNYAEAYDTVTPGDMPRLKTAKAAPKEDGPDLKPKPAPAKPAKAETPAKPSSVAAPSFDPPAAPAAPAAPVPPAAPPAWGKN